MRISRGAAARRRREDWALQGFGNLPPIFLVGRNRREKPKKRFEPPKAKTSRRPIFPLEIKKWWGELPELYRFMAILTITLMIVIFIVLPALEAYFKSQGR